MGKLNHRNRYLVILVLLGIILAATIAVLAKYGHVGRLHENPKDGSAKRIEGTTLVVTIFASDASYSWDFRTEEDQEKRENVRTYLDIAGDYLTEQVANYGANATFITDFEEYEDLCYEVTLDADLENDEEATEAFWTYIDENIDTVSLKETYYADNVIFLAEMNTDETTSAISCTRNWYEGMPYDYEVVFLYYVDGGEVNPPAVYAHEMLHTFDAPDLYTEDDDYGITTATVRLVEAFYSNDIMYTCSDISDGTYVYDRITNEITEITARYLELLTE